MIRSHMGTLTTRLVLLVAVSLSAPPAFAASVFTSRPDDPDAVYLDAQSGSREGTSDDSVTLQAAIDTAATSPNGGIVFVASGRYRVTRTVYVWRGVRVIGYGATRPVFILPDSTPGFQNGVGLMVMFSHGSPRAGARTAGVRVPFSPPGSVPPNDTVPDANQGTFYSGMSNIDFEIGAGNPAAVAIRFHVAQHGILSHMDFHVGSGLAALTEIGNVGQDLRFYGGRYGILTTNTSPFWPYTLIDSVFEGQRDAAIREHMAGLTVVRTTFRNLPVAIEIDRQYPDQLWVTGSRFENVSRAAVIISNEKNATTQIGFQDALCSNVPTFARFRESGRTQPGSGPFYRVATFNHGLVVPAAGTTGRIDTLYRAEPLKALPAAPPPALPSLPPTERWVNVHALGVKGDGQTDDTDAIRRAIESHRILYFPSGFYIVRDTIALEPDTVLIALHPGMTQLDLPDSTPAYQGIGPPKPLLETPQGGTNIVSGLGIFTGGINPRATGVLWMAGERSLMDDVQLHGFAGTYLPAGVRSAFYGGRAASPLGSGRWGAQHPSVWVTRGGGGTFHNIWTPNTFAQSGFYVSDTTTPGRVYQLSAEHHLFSEIKLDRVENWEFHGPQTEEEASTSPEAVALEIADSKNITIANFHAYRVTRSYAPFPAAVRVYNSSDIHFRNVRVNAEHGYAICDENGCGTFLRAGRFAYDSAIQDVTHHLEVRERDFAVLDLEGHPPTAAPAPSVAAGGASVEKLEGGFHSISGAAVGASGTLYFVDRHQQRIFSWSQDDGLRVVSDAPLDPVNLAVDRSGNLLVLSSAGPEGTVYSFRPGAPHDELTVLQPQPSAAREGATAILPVAVWADGQFANHLDLGRYEYTTLAQMFAREVTTPATKHYVSTDGSTFLPAWRVFRQGPDGSYPGMDETGWRWSRALDTYHFVTGRPGDRIYIASGAENRTYSATVRADGTLGDLTPFAERGGESVAVDSDGNVYVASGQIFVYDRSGDAIGEIAVAERPTGLVFGGSDRRTLFVLTHHTLYAVNTRPSQRPSALKR
jgi:hypothetical protein